MFIQVKNLTKSFKDTFAVNNINFEIKESNTVGLLGPNGCGKTTSIGMMLGLIRPTKGQIIIGNEDLETADREKILSQINFASPYIELPKKLTVRQNLEIYGRLYSVQSLKDKILQLAEDLDLKQLLNRKNGELSSGQKNRVSLAKALINNPEVLLLDEPTASLDPEIGDFVRTFLENYKKEKKISILLASHNMNEVTRLCKSILMMKDGIIIDKGDPNELIKKHGRKNLEEVFLKLTRSNDEF